MQTNSRSQWQDTINPKLLQRLLRSPGVIRSQFADGIRSRSESWSNRLPLLSQISQRHATSEGLQAGQVPIVYAQPLPAESLSSAVANSIESSAPRSNQTTVIQAKFAPGASSINQDMSQVKANAVKPVVRSNPLSITSIPAIENAQDALISDVQPPQSLPVVSVPVVSVPVVSARSPSQNVFLSTPIAPKLSPLLENKLPVVQAKFVNNSSSSSQSAADATLSFGQEEQLQHSASSFQESDRAATSVQESAVREINAKKINAKQLNQLSSPSAISEANSIDSASFKSPPQELMDEKNELRSKIPLVRSTPPQSEVNRDVPLVFSDTANRTRSSSISPEITPNDSPQIRTVSQTTSTSTEGLGNHSSVVRSVPQQIIQEAESVPSNQAPQTIVSRAAPLSPPAIDVDALVDKVERKLMRRMVIERERRGWK